MTELLSNLYIDKFTFLIKKDNEIHISLSFSEEI